jgi:predicted ATPase/DNA-binding SARP family transcriptional activator
MYRSVVQSKQVSGDLLLISVEGVPSFPANRLVFEEVVGFLFESTISMRQNHWRICLFGRLQVQGDRTTLTHFSMRRGGALLACLVVRAPNPVPREELLALLWPEEAPETARNRLRVLLSGLRRSLEPPDAAPTGILAIERNAVRLVSSAFTSDYHDFLEALSAARTADETEAIHLLEKAITLYQGELLAGFYDEWILTERTRLAEMRYQALRDLVRRLTQCGRLENAIEYARQAVAAEPLDEEAHCDLMRLYDTLGQPSAGLRQYEQLKRLLQEELHAQPSEPTRRLAAQIETNLGHGMAQIRRNVRPLALRAPEQAAIAQAIPETLPLRLTRFFSREQEIASLRNLLRPDGAARLVTLLGSGGIGKTRLAIETAEQLKTDYTGRVFYVALAEITDANLIGVTLARALRLPTGPGLDPLALVITLLKQAPALLVLDNLEQLLPKAAQVVAQLLQATPLLRCLLTSRRNAGIEGEREFVLEPLSVTLPGADLEALSSCAGVSLFVDRAQTVRADFKLTAQNAVDVIELCRTLEGVPLAIELAAARSRVMTPVEMKNQTGHLLDMLVDTQGGKPVRHRSLRATLEWSYRLLTSPEQEIFRALSVFVGGFSAEAAGAIGRTAGTEAMDMLALLERLRAASLLQSEETAEFQTRFTMLETLREFGLECLGKRETPVRRRHLAYFAQAFWKQDKPPLLWSAREIAQVTAEDANLRAALEFGLRSEATEEEQELALSLASRLSSYWEMQGRLQEGRDYLRRASRSPIAAERPVLRVNVLRGAGVLANLMGDYTDADALSREGLAIAEREGDLPSIAGCLKNLGVGAFLQDAYVPSQEWLTQALHLYQQTDQTRNIASCLAGLGDTAFFLGDHESARERLEAALTLYRQLRDRHGIASALLQLGNVWRNQGYFAEGRTRFLEAMEIFTEIGHRLGIAHCLHDLGNISNSHKDYSEAHRLYAEALAIFREVGSQRGVAVCLRSLGTISEARKEYAEALSYYEEAIEICRKIGDRRYLATCLHCMGYVAFHQCNYAVARPLHLEALAIEQEIGSRGGIANCLTGLARVALAQNDLGEARTRYDEALTVYSEMEVWMSIAEQLEDYVVIAFRQGQFAQAARLAGAIYTARNSSDYTAYYTKPQVWQELLDELREALGRAGFEVSWRQGQALTLPEAIAEALAFPHPTSSAS